jgi:membrane protease YdiL (CAAX protease family)
MDPVIAPASVSLRLVLSLFAPMLFYIKRFISLEVAVIVGLGTLGYWGMQSQRVSFAAASPTLTVGLGMLGALWLTLWTLLIQFGYGVAKSKPYAWKLTASLAKEYAHAGALQIALGGLTACAEELFFRGFIQQTLGLIPASLLFMLAHFGKRDIRVISFWSFFQGLYLGLFLVWSDSLLVPMIAHGLFDVGGMIYFRDFMTRQESTA